MDLILAADFLSNATVSVCVVDLRDGTTVYEKNPDLVLNPASNVKLVTTAAALQVLGPEHRFATRALADPKQLRNGTLHGPLYLQGSGDPALVTGELFELATRLRAAGLTELMGAIVIDNTRFDHDGLPPGYDQKDEFASYRAPGGAASINFNTYQLVARPGPRVGSKTRATTLPAIAGIQIINEGTTTEGRRKRLTVRVDRTQDLTTITLGGSMGVDASPAHYRYPIQDPSDYTGEVFRMVLRQAGITVGSKTIKTGATPDSAKTLATHRSDPVSVQIRAINKLSNNFMAEQLLRTLARNEGATAKDALDVLRAFTRAIEMPQNGLQLGNGSGLYDNNRMSAAQLTHLLTVMHRDFRYRSDFVASLAVAGTEGTLRKRLKSSSARRWIRGKTGTLNGISALSGYAGAEGGSLYAFSILFNDLDRWETGTARKTQNRIAEQLATEAARRAK